MGQTKRHHLPTELYKGARNADLRGTRPSVEEDLILRFVFWIGLVTVFVPHEPVIMPKSLSCPTPAITCSGSEQTSDARPFFAEWRDKIWEGLPRLKTDLNRHQQDRLANSTPLLSNAFTK